jgi:hypothetical protein
MLDMGRHHDRNNSSGLGRPTCHKSRLHALAAIFFYADLTI